MGLISKPRQPLAPCPLPQLLLSCREEAKDGDAVSGFRKSSSDQSSPQPPAVRICAGRDECEAG